MPLAVVIGSLAPFGVQLLVFLLCYVPFAVGAEGWRPDFLQLALLPFWLLQAAVFALGVSLLTSALSGQSRDTNTPCPS